jgi:hypothetical protein
MSDERGAKLIAAQPNVALQTDVQKAHWQKC